MTPEEHTARAMLMGRIYIQWAHVYVIPEQWHGNAKIGVPESWLDADTLQEMPHDSKMDRLLGVSNKQIEEAIGEWKLEVPEWQRN